MNSFQVYIRPLKLEDARISYKWRNNPLVWKYTGAKPDKIITPETEAEWLAKCLERTDEYRFAICLEETQQYIGNVQLIRIEDNSAEFHIFIGEPQFWGKGIGKTASSLVIAYAFETLKLDSITLTVNKYNKAANEIYNKMKFQKMGSNDDFIEMILTRQNYENNYKLKKFVMRLSKMASSIFVGIHNFFEFL